MGAAARQQGHPTELQLSQAPTCSPHSPEHNGHSQRLTELLLDHVQEGFSQSFISPLRKGVATAIHLHPCSTNTSVSPSQQIVSKGQ